MQITNHVNYSYNARRYSRPWAALIIFDGTKPKYDFCGTFLGTHQYGSGEGTVHIEANPGDIVAFGQKDNRGNGTSQTWYIVNQDGSITEIDRNDALEHYNNKPEAAINPLAQYTVDQLQAEIDRRK